MRVSYVAVLAMLPPPDLSDAPDRAVIAWILEGSAAACRELRHYLVSNTPT